MYADGRWCRISQSCSRRSPWYSGRRDNEAGASLRAPQNSHMTVLAPVGVPMLVLWIALQVAGGLALVRTILRLRSQSDEERRWPAILTWFLSIGLPCL